MEHLQTLLLPLLLVMCPPGSSHYPWNRRWGGGEAKAASRTHATPYMAYLQGQDKRFCGGFLVAPNWVMTAAQCLDYQPLTVILGAHTIQKKEESWQTFGVKEYHRHPHFRSREEGKDILLLKLDGNATSTRHVRTISLGQNTVYPNTKCNVVGWGNETGSVTLREATVTVLKRPECLNYNLALQDGVLCAFSASRGIPGEGDVGDPLVCNKKAYGIFSYRHSTWPGFYTDIYSYLEWVKPLIKSA